MNPNRIGAMRTYTIGEMCRAFGCTPRTLRYYEERALLAPTRSHGVRRYSNRDRARLTMILNGRSVGLTLTQMAELFDIYDVEGEAAQERRAVEMFQRRLIALETQRVHMDKAITALRAACEQFAKGGGLRGRFAA